MVITVVSLIVWPPYLLQIAKFVSDVLSEEVLDFDDGQVWIGHYIGWGHNLCLKFDLVYVCVFRILYSPLVVTFGVRGVLKAGCAVNAIGCREATADAMVQVRSRLILPNASVR